MHIIDYPTRAFLQERIKRDKSVLSRLSSLSTTFAYLLCTFPGALTRALTAPYHNSSYNTPTKEQSIG